MAGAAGALVVWNACEAGEKHASFELIPFAPRSLTDTESLRAFSHRLI